ncbi:unnamed protein product [Linum trigynum]|uniref:Uncharacterized protein n=1 Tax=Linum trigynum TaxID=586398 RepID=A0AAV2GJY3_9ROSI
MPQEEPTSTEEMTTVSGEAWRDVEPREGAAQGCRFALPKMRVSATVLGSPPIRLVARPWPEKGARKESSDKQATTAEEGELSAKEGDGVDLLSKPKSSSRKKLTYIEVREGGGPQSLANPKPSSGRRELAVTASLAVEVGLG